MSEKDLHENCHKKVFEIYKPYFDQHFEILLDRIGKVEEQTTKTNGRVNKLEAARDRMIGRREAYILIGKVTGWVAGTGLTFFIIIGTIYSKIN